MSFHDLNATRIPPTHACRIAAHMMDGSEKFDEHLPGDCPLVIGQQMVRGHVEHLFLYGYNKINLRMLFFQLEHSILHLLC